MAIEAEKAPAILAVLLILILVNGAFVIAQARAGSQRDKRLEEHVAKGLDRARAALAAAREVQAQEEAARLVTALVLVALGLWGVPIVYRWLYALFSPLPEFAAATAAIAVAILGVVFVHLVLSQYVPERLARLPSSTRALSTIVLVFYRLAYPFWWLAHKAEAAISRIAEGRLPRPTAQQSLPGPAGVLALASRGRGLLGATQREILTAYFDYNERSLGEIMVPLRDVASVSSSMRIREARDAVRHFGFTRYPVYEGEPDHIIGFVHYRELVDGAEAMPRAPVTDVMHSTITLASRMPVSEALQAMQARGCQIAVVADEHGATMGIVTVEDILVELVLESPPQPREEPLPRSVEVAPGVFEVDGGLLVEEVEDLLDADVEHAGFETIGGYVFGRLGRKPKIGDTVNAGCLVIEVIEARGARIKRLRVQRSRGAPPPRLKATPKG